MNPKIGKRKPAGNKTRLTPGVDLSARRATVGVKSVSDLVSYSSTRWNQALFSLLAIAGISAFRLHFYNFSTFFFTSAVVFASSFLLPVKRFNHVLMILVAGWVLCLLALGDMPNFTYAFTFLGGLSLPNPVFHFAVGFGLLLGFWRFLPPASSSQDLTKISGRVWFWIILGAAVFLRFQKITEAPGAYWDDPAVCIIDPQGILNFHEYVMLFPLGQREPFFSYFLAGLWSLDPHAHAIFIQRFGGALLDLAAAVVFYFAGKEAGGLVTGLVAEAAVAFSKPLLIEDIIGMTAVTVALAVGLLLLTTIRLFKKPDWPRFIQWGLALGFAPYNYTPVRTWLPFLVTAVFLWIWFFKLKDRPKKWPEFILGWGIVLVWNVLFLKVNNFLPLTVLSFGVGMKNVLTSVLLGLFCFCAFRLVFRKNLEFKNLLPQFFLGVVLSAALIYPLASQPDIAEHTSGLSIFHNQETRTFHYENSVPAFMVKKTMASLETMFYSGQDRGDLNLPWDAFFEFHFVPLFVIGMAAFLSRPAWLTFFLIMAGFVGISTHILSIDPHSAKLVAAVAPLAIFSGLGIQQFFSSVPSNLPRFKPVMAAASALFLGWAIWGTYDRVWQHYFKTDGIDKIVSRSVAELSGQYRVYFAVFQDFASPETQTLLDEGRPVFMLRDRNPIYLREGQSPQDVAVLLSTADKRDQDRIQRDFPHASWSVIKSNREGTPDVLRIAKIPAADIPFAPGKCFECQKITDSDWIRDYSVGSYLLYSDLVAEEDVAPSPYAPIAPDMGGDIVRMTGNITLPASGKLELKVTSSNYAIITLDGKTVLDFRPWVTTETAVKSVSASRGTHQVSYLAFLHVGNDIPEIKMSLNGQPDGLMGLLAPVSAAPVSAPQASMFHLGPPSH